MNFNPSDPHSLDQVRERVRKGAELLDETYDRWWDAIDLDTLEIDHTDHCILGQLGKDSRFGSGDYNHMRSLVFADWTGDEAESAEAHGFDIVGGNQYWEEEYAALTDEWKTPINERKNT